MPIVAGFLSAYPAVSVEMLVEDGLTDIVASGFDAGVRFGETLEQDMVAVPIGPSMRAAIVASPTYLQGRPPSRTRRSSRSSLHRSAFRWRSSLSLGLHEGWSRLKGGSRGCLTLNDDALVVQAALQGVGIGFAFEAAVEPYISSGRLIRCSRPGALKEPGFHLYYTSKRLMRPALRAFIDFARAKRKGQA